MSALCHELLTWPIDASRGGVARWKGWDWIWAGLRMRAYYYPGGNFQRKSAADPSRFRDLKGYSIIQIQHALGVLRIDELYQWESHS